jgi:hypothetical protein
MAEAAWEDCSTLKVAVFLEGDRIQVPTSSLKGDKSAAKNTCVDQYRLHEAEACRNE